MVLLVKKQTKTLVDKSLVQFCVGRFQMTLVDDGADLDF